MRCAEREVLIKRDYQRTHGGPHELVLSPNRDEQLKWLGLHSTQVEETWQRALQILKDQGHDPDVLIAQAAKNLKAWNDDEKS